MTVVVNRLKKWSISIHATIVSVGTTKNQILSDMQFVCDGGARDGCVSDLISDIDIGACLQQDFYGSELILVSARVVKGGVTTTFC